MAKKFYDTVIGIRISKEQKEKLDAIAQLAEEKTSRLVRDCLECLINQDACLARAKYKKLKQ